MSAELKNSLPVFAKTKAYVVGGSVRDRLLGRPTTDVDLAVPSGAAGLAKKMAAKLKGSAFPLDKDRGIYRVSTNKDIHFDIATFQGKTLAADLARRDFTINAMAVPLNEWLGADWKKSLIDPHQGTRDVAKKQMVPVAASVFVEDPLRLLRAFRIAAELDFSVPPATKKMISKYRKLIKKPAPERRREELLRLFSTPHAAPFLFSMEECGLLEQFFPEAVPLRKAAHSYYGKGGVLKHTLDSVACFEDILRDKTWFSGVNDQIAAYLSDPISGYPRGAHCKWGLLLHDIGKPATMKMMGGRLRFFEHEHVGADKVPKMAPRFRWSSDETARYGKLVRNHMRPGNLATHSEVSDKAIHRFFRDLGDDAVAMLLVSLGDHLTYLTPAQRRKRNSAHEKLTIRMVRRYYTQREKVIPPKLVTGHDIMKTLKISPSPLIGALLSDLTEAQSEGAIHTKKQALDYLKGRLSWHQQRIPAQKPART